MDAPSTRAFGARAASRLLPLTLSRQEAGRVRKSWRPPGAGLDAPADSGVGVGGGQAVEMALHGPRGWMMGWIAWGAPAPNPACQRGNAWLCIEVRKPSKDATYAPRVPACEGVMVDSREQDGESLPSPPLYPTHFFPSAPSSIRALTWWRDEADAWLV